MGRVRTARRVAWTLWRRGRVVATARDGEVLQQRLRPVADWAETPDGRARRLGPDETILVTQVGRFAEVDPRLVATGWRSFGRGAGVLVWSAAVGLAWWRGSSRGRGPLRHLGR
ncbi:hypothetical protein FTX61_02800 [Nitriliruptoraceae bacterium ZYF776]|nr:hypothetical protein [Profundirhabdus halotolerans]